MAKEKREALGHGADGKLKAREKLAFGVGDMGSALTFGIVTSFLSLYYTDNVGISAAVVGTMMLFVRVLDGISDLIFGTILDRTQTKIGKARPWILASTPAMTIGIILLFNVPGKLGDSGRIVYITLTYIFFTVIAYTASNLSYNTVLSLMTSNSQERTNASTVRFICTLIASTVVNMITLGIVGKIGWEKTSVVYGLAAAVFFLITFFGTKERIVSTGEQDGDGTNNAKLSFVDNFKVLFKNRYFISLAILAVTIFLSSGSMTGSMVYYCKDVLGDESTYALVSLAGMPPMLIALMAFPALTKKFGKWKCLMTGLILIAGGSVLILLIRGNFIATIVCCMIRNLGLAPLSAGMYALAGDVVDYGEWKNEIRQDGMVNSAMSFGQKVGTGLGSACVGWGLSLGGYQGTLAVQAAGTVNMITYIFALLPMVVAIIGMVALYFTNLDKIYAQVSEDLAERHRERGSY